jgi:hypothetical protein
MTRGFLKADGNDWLVGASDLSNEEYPYHGPVARVSCDDKWLVICTDDHEGYAMLNVEALPFLRRALGYLDRKRWSERSRPGRPLR